MTAHNMPVTIRSVTRSVGADFREETSVAERTVYGRIAHVSQRERAIAAQLGQTADVVLYLTQGASIDEDEEVEVDAEFVAIPGLAGVYDVSTIQHTRRGPQVSLRRRTV